MTKKSGIFYFTIILCLISLSCSSLQKNIPNQIIKEKPIYLIGDEIKKKTAVITIGTEEEFKEHVAYATGFFIKYYGARYFVTAAHTAYKVQNEYKLQKLYFRCWLNNRFISLNHFAIEPKSDVWLLKPNKEVDDDSVFEISNRLTMETLKAGVEILFCGFPLNYKDKKNILNFTYILRKAMISGTYPINAPDDMRMAYIIDNLVSKGDSGGPVINLHKEELIGFIKGFKMDPREPDRDLGLGIVVPIKHATQLIDSVQEEKYRKEASRKSEK